eukprot:CAMPEP_0176456550 /NCGR_PEP_ID=MMETSP0127-20121128/31355_1 /TAXON_ID=938130 /ORGANISM="Platyophrya macrostoma, Strain WH" /LENGTH=435 /DNA_ID=CAMNT_0017846531 /DNA_START=1 /DNA_END=1308 /DNA_ORIENTATION=+
MMFIGFGFLMTYLVRHSWSSVGINFLVTVVAIQVYFLSAGLWKRVFGEESWEEKIHIQLLNLIQADYAAASVLIAFGGVLGKLSPFQMLFLTIIQIFVYAFNEVLVFHTCKVFDVGGSMTIHAFGAYFGLAVSLVTTDKAKAKDHPDNTSNYTSNLFAMFGTLFLFMFWPSFNSGPENGNGMLRTQIATLFSLIGSAFTVFMFSTICRNGKFHMEDILNATLAGGVAIGSAANIVQNPMAAFIVGCVSGGVSIFGFEKLSGILQRKIGLYDTAGIHNLHGMPGLLGGVISAIFAAAMTPERLGTPVEDYFFGRSAHLQGGWQIVGTFVSIGIGILGGIFTGLFLKIKWLNPPKEYFSDLEFWHMDGAEEDWEQPVAKGGEIQMAVKTETDRGVTDRLATDKAATDRGLAEKIMTPNGENEITSNKESPSKPLKVD